MAFIVLLDAEKGNVLFLRMTDEMVSELKNEYDNDVVAWIECKELDEKFHFRMSDCSYIMVDEMPELFGCDAETLQETRLSLFS